ncbi:hypothetical protein [Methylobacterium nodulans]|uniref:Uncharacterized protein n=1 Tax=Methylobacterium nodulans (strain LMG 21967 / CNCM I-2342 / ORS 2060) TaxID=460265 RepID=B8IK93_METNO|nr:hypothetical protein [Methylobacterium nodulans]ACL61878.1 conserved hypothetical protein [Methylobacterium nodulans ORS 2060]
MSASPRTLIPFADDATVQTLGPLTVENGTERVVLHGSLELARDRLSLERARALRRILDAVVTALEGQDLPEEAPRPEGRTQSVKNPFG